MAKKTTKKVEVKKPQLKEEVVMDTTEVLEQPKKVQQKSKNDWEIKDRFYLLKGTDKPLSKLIKGCNIYWFDEEQGLLMK